MPGPYTGPSRRRATSHRTSRPTSPRATPHGAPVGARHASPGRHKEKPHRFRPQTFGTESDAARPGWAEDRASAYLASLFLSIPGQVRVLFPHQKRQINTATESPERSIEGVGTKKPLCGNRQGKNSELKLLQTSAPASTLSLRLTLLPPACCSRGQV
jgi:hypothetical protein